MNNKDLISINILRGFAAFGVYYYHQHIGSIIALKTNIRWIEQSDYFGAVLAVPLFFLISGYCIHLSNLKYIKEPATFSILDYYKRRFWRIYPPYIIALLLSIAIFAIVKPVIPVHPEDFLIHMLSFQGFSASYFNTINLVLWTISIELAFYLIYPLFFYSRIKLGLFKGMLLPLCFSIISIGYFSNKADVTLPERYFVLNLWFAWCFGAFLSELKEMNGLKKKNFYCVLAYLIFLILFFIIRLISWDNDFLIKDQLNIILWSGPLLFLVQKEKWLQEHNNLLIKLLDSIGLSSYSLYLLHEPLIRLKNYLISIYFISHKDIAMSIAIFVIPLLCYFNYLLFEKPFIRFRKRAN